MCDHVRPFEESGSYKYTHLLDLKQSLKNIHKEIFLCLTLEGLRLKLKLQYFGHLKGRPDSLEKILIWERLKAGGEGDNRG